MGSEQGKDEGEATDTGEDNRDTTLLWTVRETARQLAVCPRTVSRLIDKGVFPMVRYGGRKYLPRRAVLDWVEAQTRYNSRCAGLAVRHPKGERKCLSSAKRRKVSTGVKEVGTGGHLTQRQAVGEFNALLGQPPRGKR